MKKEDDSKSLYEMTNIENVEKRMRKLNTSYLHKGISHSSYHYFPILMTTKMKKKKVLMYQN